MNQIVTEGASRPGISSRVVRVVRQLTRRSWLLVAAGLGVAVVAAIVFFGFSDEQAAATDAPERPPVVSDGAVVLTMQQRQQAGIAVNTATLRSVPRTIRAPGEVKADDYRTRVVASRVSAAVITRYAKLGDRVRDGQPLVTLFSSEVAEAQSAFVSAERDFQRLKRLGRMIVPAAQIEQAEIKREETRGRLDALGITASQIARLASQGMPSGRAGQFVLVANGTGKITLDDFRAGQVVEPGKALFEISDTERLWVEARVSPTHASEIGSDSARVIVDGRERPAKVIQIGDRLDEETRTISVRLEIENTDNRLKPGQFVDVALHSVARGVIALPTQAVIRNSAGDWIVFIEKAPNRFVPHKVQMLYGADDNAVVSGIDVGTPVVTAGAFFVMAEGDKASFGDE